MSFTITPHRTAVAGPLVEWARAEEREHGLALGCYPRPPRPAAGLGSVGEGVMPVIVGVAVLGIIGLIGYAIVKGVQTQASMMKAVAEKEGVKGVLALTAGQAAVGLLSHAGHRAMERNPRRRRRSRR